MVGNFLRRFGVGLLAAAIGAASQFVGTFDWTELGAFAVLAAALAALVAGGLAKLREKVLNWLGDTPAI